MKITARISAAMGQLKASAAHTFGKAFGRTTRATENPGLNRVQTEPTAMVKTAKGDFSVIKNGKVDFILDGHEVFKDGMMTEYRIHAKHDTVMQLRRTPISVDHVSCRHMAAMELARRESEKVHPGAHTKADRVKIFDVKNAPQLATQRQYLERRMHDIFLYSNDVHVFNNAKTGAFLEAELGKLKVGKAKNFALLTETHAMTLTIKHKKDGYSVSIWDPNRVADHIKMKFSSPEQASKISMEKLLGEQSTAYYTNKGPNIKAWELPTGWAKDTTKRTPKINVHFYDLGPITTETTKRSDWVNNYPRPNIS